MTALDNIPTHSPAPVPARLGQGTAVEQSRAVAEVQAAIIVAQRCPRDVVEAQRQMRESCAQEALASRAFFRFPRSGQTVTGPSVHLARDLARCWGNVQYGLTELRRDDVAHQSEMLAWAWDVQTNTRATHTFIVPHARDTKGGPKPLEDLRDVYENNANQGARRVREAIFAILPPWYVEEAKDLCQRTIAHGGGKPLATRIADAIDAFASIGVRTPQLEERIGRKRAEWDANDVAQLGVIFQSIRRGEVRAEEEFAPATVTADEIAAAIPPAEPEPTPQRRPSRRTRAADTPAEPAADALPVADPEDPPLPDPHDGNDPWATTPSEDES
jgi:hypothetical protein